MINSGAASKNHQQERPSESIHADIGAGSSDSLPKSAVDSAISALMSLKTNKVFQRAGIALAASAALTCVGSYASSVVKLDRSAQPESPYVVEARAMAEDLMRRGRLKAKVQVKESVIPHSTGIANWDFSSQTCVMEIDSAQVERSAYKDRVGFKFFIYHELSHCETFRSPGGFFAFAGLDASEQKVMDEFMSMDWFEADREGHGMDQATHLHEVHADVQATLWMLEEGIPGSALRPFIEQRSANWMDKVHNSVDAFEAATRVDPAQLKGDALDVIGKAITGEFMLRTQFIPIYFQNDQQNMMDLATLSRQRVQALHNRMEALGTITLGEAIKKIESVHPSNLNAYPTYHFIVQVGKESALKLNEKTYVHAWEHTVFGGHLQETADRASEKLHRWSIEHVISQGEKQTSPGSATGKSPHATETKTAGRAI